MPIFHATSQERREQSVDVGWGSNGADLGSPSCSRLVSFWSASASAPAAAIMALMGFDPIWQDVFIVVSGIALLLTRRWRAASTSAASTSAVTGCSTNSHRPGRDQPGVGLRMVRVDAEEWRAVSADGRTIAKDTNRQDSAHRWDAACRHAHRREIPGRRSSQKSDGVDSGSPLISLGRHNGRSSLS